MTEQNIQHIFNNPMLNISGTDLVSELFRRLYEADLIKDNAIGKSALPGEEDVFIFHHETIRKKVTALHITVQDDNKHTIEHLPIRGCDPSIMETRLQGTKEHEDDLQRVVGTFETRNDFLNALQIIIAESNPSILNNPELKALVKTLKNPNEPNNDAYLGYKPPKEEEPHLEIVVNE